MDQPKRKYQKVRRRLLWMLVALALVLAALPIWFPWALKPLLGFAGVRYADYGRTSYSQFTLTGVTAEWPPVQLEVKRIESALPTTWLWSRLSSNTNTAPLLRVQDAELRIAEPSRPTAADDSGSLHQTLDGTLRTARLLQHWLPAAELTNCRILVASNLVLLHQAEWRRGRLQARSGLPVAPGEIELIAELRPNTTLRFAASSKSYQSSLQGELARADAGWKLTGEAQWRSNQINFTARFPANGYWPAQARLESPTFRVPPELIPWDGYQALTAAWAVNLASNQFDLEATGTAQATGALAARGFPAVEFALAAGGDPESFTLRELWLKSPWLNAVLTDSIGMDWSGEMEANPAQFQVVADLNELPGAAMTGRIEGLVRVEPRGANRPVARFDLSATNTKVWQVDTKAITLSGEFNVPELKIGEFNATFADGSTLSAHGLLNFETAQVQEGEWKFSGGYLNRFLPDVPHTDATGSGQVSGPLTNLNHAGNLKITGVQPQRLKPMDAEINWTAQQLKFDSLAAEVVAGESALAFAGVADLSDFAERRATASLTNLTLHRAGAELYALQQPSTISFLGGSDSTTTNWTLAVSSFDWAGSSRKLALAGEFSWPSHGTVSAALTNFAVSDFADFVTNDLPKLTLGALAVTAGWSNGPVRAAVYVAGEVTEAAAPPIRWHADITAEESVSINQLSVETGVVPTLSFNGSIPVKVVPGRKEGLLAWNESQAIALSGNWESSRTESIALPLGTRGKIEIAKPGFKFRIAGTPAAPEGTLELAAGAISWQSPSNTMIVPRLEDLRLKAGITPHEIKLDALDAKLEGQELIASGVWPLPEGVWQTLWTEPVLPDWSQASGRLVFAKAQVAALAHYVPDLLVPEGQLSATVELHPGKRLTGFTSLTNVSTRPFGNLSPLREIAAVVRFDGEHARLENFQGQIGGQPILGNGHIQLRPEGGLDYEVQLRGTNVPLVRSLQSLLRGDFDLQLRSGSDAPPVLSGGVNLHDGLFLQHASALFWSGPTRPELHPPYFSVTNEPVAAWQMNVAVTGDRFLRVSTPVFKGLLSANLRVRGPLRQPILTGDVRVNDGRVLFPFGTLEVNQGYATFSGNDPQGPDLRINATGRNYRYDVRVEVKGPAENAAVLFSSTPPLTSEQIVLMLTAGELPQTDYTFSSGARAGRLASFLGMDLLSRFLGTDRGEERLIFRTGESISQEGRLTYSVEYKLTDRWSVIGEYDEYNAFNTDLKWKILTR